MCKVEKQRNRYDGAYTHQVWHCAVRLDGRDDSAAENLVHEVSSTTVVSGRWETKKTTAHRYIREAQTFLCQGQIYNRAKINHRHNTLSGSQITLWYDITKFQNVQLCIGASLHHHQQETFQSRCDLRNLSSFHPQNTTLWNEQPFVDNQKKIMDVLPRW